MLSQITDNYATMEAMQTDTPQDPLKVVQDYLQPLGIEPDATRIYAELSRLGPSSALQLSKATAISRTQTYRHIEQLQASGLVSAEQLSYGTLFRALPLENVEGLIANREAETRAMKRGLEGVALTLATLAGNTGPKSTTAHYYGLGGLKQVNWNLTKATKEFKVFEAAHLSEHFDKAFARRCRERYIERELVSYDLTNATSARARDLEPYEPGRSFIRHIDPEILQINFEMYMYDDTVTMIDYAPEQPHATEIHHPALATMMKQLFDAMWQIAVPLEISR